MWPRLAVACVLGLYSLEMVRTAWITDDAAITIRTVLNFINGYGARFNIDERVQAYTHPLWFLVVSAASVLTHNVFTATFLLSGACSLAAMYLLLRSATTLTDGVIGAVALLLSKAYIDFSTSGLENPLSHLVVLATVLAAFRAVERDEQQWLTLSMSGAAAAYLTRPDLVLLVLPPVIFAVARRRPPIRVVLRVVAIAAIPVVAWTAVATYYYGFPFPNPAYAKLGPGIPLNERVVQGGYYLLRSVTTDPMTPFIIGLGLVAGFRSSGISAAITVGLLLYLVYVVSIGGDFMEGRFLTAPSLLGALLLAKVQYGRWGRIVLAVCIAGLGVIEAPKTILSGRDYVAKDLWHGIADERGVYFSDYGWLNDDDGVFGAPNWTADAGPHCARVRCGGLGWASLTAGPSIHFIDFCALADPLLARLPAKEDPEWRIGHFMRQLPTNYKESVETDTNLLSDPATRDYYGSIRLITRGPLADVRRLREMVRMNFGMVPLPDGAIYRSQAPIPPSSRVTGSTEASQDLSANGCPVAEN